MHVLYDDVLLELDEEVFTEHERQRVVVIRCETPAFLLVATVHEGIIPVDQLQSFRWSEPKWRVQFLQEVIAVVIFKGGG